jgi:uncharacterized phage protein (TIGR02216 family)
MKGGLPWTEWLAIAAVKLGLSPEAFWRLSVWEWLALMEIFVPQAPSRGELAALLRAHPDTNAYKQAK